MKTKDLDLSIYQDSELVPIHKTNTKLEILKRYLKTKEQKFKKAADISGVTAVITGVVSPLTSIATGIGLSTTPELVNSPSGIFLAAASATGIATSIASYIIHKRNRAKQADYKFLKECAEAGLEDNRTLEKARYTLKHKGSNDTSTLYRLSEIIKDKTSNDLTATEPVDELSK